MLYSYSLFGQCLLLAMLFFSCQSAGLEEEPQPIETGAFELDLPTYMSNVRLPEDNPLTHEGVRLGRMLFYETALSSNNSISCGSCHQQQFAFADNKPHSPGVLGSSTGLNAMSLSNLIWTNHLNWNGSATSLEEQAFMPLTHPDEMNQPIAESVRKLEAKDLYPPLFQAAFGDDKITGERIAKALAQFQRTLLSTNSKYDQYLRGELALTERERNGMQLFFMHPEPRIGLRGGNCGDCHLGALLAGSRRGFDGFHNNGLDSDENLKDGLKAITGMDYDKGKFRAPHLRNIALTAPYMHDGRFATLEQVLDHYNEHIQRSKTLDPLIIEASNEVIEDFDAPIKLHLTEQEKQDIILFLHTLTDSEFITNPAFSNPHR
ncbi:MAG: cytochrome-c peroxidase [Bernardetiaceae bacterium]|nr:cytochrome-c peroxidase [Bernardetiaceae bacterium]